MEMIPDVGGGVEPYRVLSSVGVNGEGMVAGACDVPAFPRD